MSGTKRVFCYTALALLSLGPTAHAANWLQLQGSESTGAPAFKPFGLIQPTYTHIDAEPVRGLTGAVSGYNGQYQFANQVGPDLDGHSVFQFNRARLGARGVLRPVSERLNYLVMVEAGRNAMTSEDDLVLSDASLTLDLIPGARLRAGLFKLPLGEEALASVNDYPYVYFSNATMNLLVEQPVIAATGSVPAGLSAAKASDGCNCFHDWGIQAFDWVNSGPWEFAYAAAISNGAPIDDLASDPDGNKDLTWRLQASHVFGGQGPDREDATVYAWRQDGDRRFGGRDYGRTREGLGFKYQRRDHHLSGEYIRGEGMIMAGPYPAFQTAPVYAVGLTDKASGWYLEGGWRFMPKWEVDLRYETFELLSATPANTRQIDTWTLGLQHFIDRRTRVAFNYEFRRMAIPHPEALSGIMRTMAPIIAENLGDRASLQLSWWF